MFELDRILSVLRRRNRRVVYTCLFGYSELFNDLIYERDAITDFICFTDDPKLRSDFWQIKYVPRGDLDPARAARRYKIQAHLFLRRYDASLYIDNTIRLKVAPREVFDRFLQNSSSSHVCFRHPWRQCIYDEAEEVVALGYESAERVEAQMNSYRQLGYPAGNGLFAGGFHLRRHNDPAAIKVMETWFQQVLTHSWRDQLSFNVAAWLHRFEPDIIDLDISDNDILEWPYPRNLVRIPHDFCDERYLMLNPDVKAARVNPRRHYLMHGFSEGRQYK